MDDGVWLSLARAPGLGPGGRRFESCHPDSYKYARVAQLVERDLAKVEAAGSSPVSRSKRNTKRWYPIGYHLFCVFEPRRDSKVRGLRSAPVVVKRMSAGHSTTSRALKATRSNAKKQRKYTENLACFRYKDKNFAEKDKMLCLLSRL